MKITDIKIKSTDITSENYENIFNIYTDEDGFYYYNLLRNLRSIGTEYLAYFILNNSLNEMSSRT